MSCIYLTDITETLALKEIKLQIKLPSFSLNSYFNVQGISFPSVEIGLISYSNKPSYGNWQPQFSLQI